MTMYLRSSRPQQFPRLESLDIPPRRLESSEEEEEEYYDLYQSPCLQMASNEEFSPKQIDNFDVCDSTFFGGCFEDETAMKKKYKDDLYEMTIYFDYELWYKDGAIPTRTIQHLEDAMLDHLAAVFGLKTCGRRVQQSQGEYAHGLTDDELDRFIGLSRTPMDFIDADFADCMIPVAADRAAMATCQPVTGITTLYLENDSALTYDAKLSIQSGMMKLIRFGMKNDLYLPGNVQNLAFIGTRTSDEANYNSFRETDPAQASNTNGSLGDDPSRTAGIIGGLAAVVLLVAMFLFASPRRKKDTPADAPEQQAPDTNDVAPAYSPGLHKPSAQEVPPEHFETQVPMPPPTEDLTIANSSLSSGALESNDKKIDSAQ